MRKGWGVLLAAAIGAIASPSTALADQYTAQACLQPGGGAGHGDDLIVTGSAPFQVTVGCEQGSPARIVATSPEQSGSRGFLVAAPPGAEILAATVYHRATIPVGAELRAIVTRDNAPDVIARSWGPGIAGSLAQASASGTGDTVFTTSDPPARTLQYVITCPSSADCSTLDASLYAVKLQLRDLSSPAVGVQARSAGNAIDTDVQATDTGSGVKSVRVLLDGQQLEQRDSNCSTRIAPCPSSVDVELAPSTDGLADGPHRLRVEVRDHVGRETASEVDVVVDRQAPVPLGAPGMVGTAEVGGTLVAAAGAWSGQSYQLAYRWERCNAGICVAIPNSDGATYVVRDEDQEHQLRVVEVATDGGGSSEQRSAPGPSVAPQVPLLVEPLQISGEEKVGGRLTATAGAWRNAVSLRYQWMSCSRRDGTDCVALPGRERPFLDVERDDVGRYLLVVVTATGPRGHTRQASAASGRIPSPPLRNLTEPSVGGTATVGGRLTAETGGWEGTGIQFELQWLRCATNGCLPISGAIARTYTPTSKDLGRTLVVLVTAKDALGETLPIRSRPSERVRAKGSSALAVPRVRTKVRIVSFGEYQFALTVGPTLQVLDVSKGSRVDVLCRLCARARLGKRSKVRGGSVKFRLPSDGVQIPPGGQIVVRVRRKGSIGREIVGTLSLDRSRRVSWSSPRCLDRDGSLRTVECPAVRRKSTKTTGTKGTSQTKTSATTQSAGLAVPVR